MSIGRRTPGVVKLTDGLLPKRILEESRSSLRRPPFSPTRPGLADFLAGVWRARREGQYLSIYRTDFRGSTPEIQGVALSSNITNHARMSFRHGAALVRVVRLRNRHDFLRHVRTIPHGHAASCSRPGRTRVRRIPICLAPPAGGPGHRQSSIQPSFYRL